MINVNDVAVFNMKDIIETLAHFEADDDGLEWAYTFASELTGKSTDWLYEQVKSNNEEESRQESANALKVSGIVWDTDEDDVSCPSEELVIPEDLLASYSDWSVTYAIKDWLRRKYGHIVKTFVIKPSKWIYTDGMQIRRRVGAHLYELLEANEVDGMFMMSTPMYVDIADYIEASGEPNREIKSIAASYYGSWEDFMEQYAAERPDEREGIMSEMVYEQKSDFTERYGLLTEADVEFVLEKYIQDGRMPDEKNLPSVKDKSSI